MSTPPLVLFLSGAVALAYAVASAYFFRFWRTTRDGLFFSFGCAFLLLTVNQILVGLLDASDERTGYTYLLRVIGFMLILVAIVLKNTRRARPND